MAQLSGAVRKAGIRCPHQLVVGARSRDGVAAAAAAARAVLSTFYVLMAVFYSDLY